MKRLILPVLLISGFTLSAQNLEEAKRLTLNEQFEASSSSFRKLVEKEPAKGDNWFYYGENLLKSENQDSAKILYSQGASNEAANPLNYIGLGKIAKLEGRQDEASQLFAKALQIGNNKNVEVLLRVAEAHILIDKKDIPQAFTLLQTAQKLQPRNPEAQLLQGDAFLESNDGSSAVKFYEEAHRLDPKSPAALLRLGQLWVRARNYQGKDGAKGALEYYQEAVALSPDFAPAYHELGDLYAMAKRYPDAQTNYTKYLELSKGNIASRKRYASVLFLMADYPGALREIEKITAVDTSYNVLNRLAAYSYFETKNFEAGLKSIEKFFLKQPESKILPTDYAYYGKLLSATGQDSLAILKITQAIAADTSVYDLYSDLGTLYAKQKRHPEAVAAYQKKVGAGKAVTNDYFRMGQSYYALKEFGKADTAFTMITDAQPKLVTGYVWRARSNSNLDPDSKLGLARPFYEQIVVLAEADTISSVKYQKDLLEAYRYLGAYFYFAKDYPNSTIFWEKVLAILPNDEPANKALEEIKK